MSEATTAKRGQGGARVGTGPKLLVPGHKQRTVSIQFDEPTLGLLDAIAHAEGVTRSEAIRSMVRRSFKRRRA